MRARNPTRTSPVTILWAKSNIDRRLEDVVSIAPATAAGASFFPLESWFSRLTRIHAQAIMRTFAGSAALSGEYDKLEERFLWR